jgi:hypothetical protein
MKESKAWYELLCQRQKNECLCLQEFRFHVPYQADVFHSGSVAFCRKDRRMRPFLCTDILNHVTHGIRHT